MRSSALKVNKRAINAAVARTMAGGLFPSDSNRLISLVPPSGKLAAYRKFYNKLEAGLLKASGVNRSDLATMRAAYQAEMQKVLRQKKTEAVKRSASISRTINTPLKYWWKGGGASRVNPGMLIDPNVELLDQADFITPSRGLATFKASMAPGNNVVKFTANYESPDNDTDKVTYIFIWQNLSKNAPAVVDVSTYLSFTGFCDVFADFGGDFYWGTEGFGWGSYTSDLYMRADLSLLEGWNNYSTQPVFQSSQRGPWFVSLRANGGGLFGLGQYKPSLPGGMQDLSYSQFTVPPQGQVLILVTLHLAHFTNGGYIEVDFAKGDFQLMCPGVGITPH